MKDNVELIGRRHYWKNQCLFMNSKQFAKFVLKSFIYSNSGIACVGDCCRVEKIWGTVPGKSCIYKYVLHILFRLHCVMYADCFPWSLCSNHLLIYTFCSFQRDEEDMVQSVRNCPPEFKEYYLQMYAAKRSQAPLLSQVTIHFNFPTFSPWWETSAWSFLVVTVCKLE